MAGNSRRCGMAPTQIPVLLSQKPSTKYSINRPAILFLAWRGDPHTHMTVARGGRGALAAVKVRLQCTGNPEHGKSGPSEGQLACMATLAALHEVSHAYMMRCPPLPPGSATLTFAFRGGGSLKYKIGIFYVLAFKMYKTHPPSPDIFKNIHIA